MQNLVEELLAQGQPAALIVEFIKAGDDVLLGGGYFHSLHGPEELADKTSHLAGGLAACAPVGFYPVGGAVGNQSH